MRKLLCRLGIHTMIWYTKYDKDLYWDRCHATQSKYVTGPLLECKYCKHRVRLENSDASKILMFKYYD